jgi:hypothetical protein
MVVGVPSFRGDNRTDRLLRQFLTACADRVDGLA